MVQGSDGVIYGTAVDGGIYGGGLYFAWMRGNPSLHRGRSVSTRDRVGWGQGVDLGSLLLLASVQFNGVAATAVRTDYGSHASGDGHHACAL